MLHLFPLYLSLISEPVQNFFEMVVEGANPVRIGEGAMGRAVESRAPVQIPDIDAPGAYTGRLRELVQRVQRVLDLPDSVRCRPFRIS